MITRRNFLHAAFYSIVALIVRTRDIFAIKEIAESDKQGMVFPGTFPITFAERKPQHRIFLPSIKRR
ncbi:hypothetical protein LCGC14_0466550 [marine sediment metagenome]|uniref:Uncharacterized protein n=1 Tax=marine sediment metagenome TaxID=412755 RepID=A0A0F9SDN8_9ZZZZ